MGLIPNGHLVFSLNPNCPVRSCPAGMSWGGAERLAGNWDYGAIFVPVIYQGPQRAVWFGFVIEINC